MAKKIKKMRTDAARADGIVTLFWDNFQKSEPAHIMRNVIEIEFEKVRQEEREACAEAVKPSQVIEGPNHGVWDRGFAAGRQDAADKIRARNC